MPTESHDSAEPGPSGPPIPPGPTASVVIPAHNEATVIGRGLQALLGTARPGEFEVVVVANGCSDGTADRARRTLGQLGHRGKVLELPLASKTAALRAGDGAATTFPRIYLDADVILPTASARRLVDALAQADMAVPHRWLDVSRSSPLAARFSLTWGELPWVLTQLSGRGAWAVGADTRAAMGVFPDVIADDRWATTRLPASSVRIVADAPVTVIPPQSLRTLVRVRARVLAGNAASSGPGGPGGPRGERHDEVLGRRLAHLAALMRHPRHWPDVAVVSWVSVASRVYARRLARSPAPTWVLDPARRAS